MTDGAGVVLAHSSDLHVGDVETTRAGGGDETRMLAAVLDAARAAAADLVVIAGDLFEHNRLPLALLDRATELLAAAGRPVVILPGNHDPLTADSAYVRGAVAEPPNVHVIGVTAPQSVVLEGLDLEVWGHAHRDYDDMVPLRRPRRRRTALQVALAHGHYHAVPNRRRRPRPAWLIGDAEIRATAADYVALGHWNQAVEVGCGAVPAWYSGAPELARSVNIVRLSPGRRAAVSRQPVDLPARGVHEIVC